MATRFFKDNFNARFVWGWDDTGYLTEDPKEIEHLKGLGLRFKDGESTTKAASTAGPNPGTIAWIKAELDKLDQNYDGITGKAELQELLNMANEPKE